MNRKLVRIWFAARHIGLPGLILLSCLTACATQPNPLVVSEFSPKLSTFVYKEEGTLVFLSVGVEAARYDREQKYFPLFITLANKDVAVLNITPESFTFEDLLGQKYSPLPVATIESEYRREVFDRKMYAQTLSHTATAVDRYNRIPSNFYPALKGGIVNDRVQLPRFGYLNDVLYFPVPEDGLGLGPFHLHFKAPELEEAVVVAFDIGEAKGS